MEAPLGFPPIEHPDGNAFTEARWSLGRKLFYDPVLSKDGRVSCATCHDPNLAFADDQAISSGADGLVGNRNASSLANIAYHPYYTREGGVPTLEMQVLVPIQEHHELGTNIVLLADTLRKIQDYVDRSIEAYGEAPSPFVITRALAQFERSLISGQSAYDLELHYGISGSMTAAAKRGLTLFESKRTQCTTCHGGFNFTDYSFANNGLYARYPDDGRARLTNDSVDIALFKVPSLRNVALTAPYMHDGSIETLDAVIDHYDRGGHGHPHQSEHIRALYLSIDEKRDLRAFLESLTDDHFVNNHNLHDE